MYNWERSVRYCGLVGVSLGHGGEFLCDHTAFGLYSQCKQCPYSLCINTFYLTKKIRLQTYQEKKKKKGKKEKRERKIIRLQNY